jgi:hypothetical protein
MLMLMGKGWELWGSFLRNLGMVCLVMAFKIEGIGFLG